VSFWSWLKGVPASESPTSFASGDPDGVEFEGEETFSRALPVPVPSGWAGWPASWSVPNWDFGSRFNELVDVAWACLDLNASVLSAMPVYRTRGGEVIPSATWMSNPDPSIYTSWHEFAKQLFWDYQLGEAFVLPVVRQADGYPLTFRVIPPWMVDVEMVGGMRVYKLGGREGPDITDDVLHIRYRSSTDSAHGTGPLEQAGGRMLTAGVLMNYVRDVVQLGGVAAQTLETDQELSPDDAQDLMNQWVTSRLANSSAPPVLDNNVKLVDHMRMSPKDMAMLEIAQFTEARIAILCGVPPFLVGLPSGDSMTYKNVAQGFDFHDRASLKTKATHVMSALSYWALPSTQSAELNRDEYTRPPFEERAKAYVALVGAGIMSVDEVRAAERLTGDAPTVALTGGDQPAVSPARMEVGSE
jgi:HK97 family phage portal protein